MIRSMTAFASASGRTGPTGWAWELRAVNGRGADIRLRLPDGIEGLEAGARAAIAAHVTRGSVTAGLRLQREAGEAALALDTAQLDRVLVALRAVETRAAAGGLVLAQSTATDILAQKGVLAAEAAEDDTDTLRDALLTGLDDALSDFVAMRATEGAALQRVIEGQLDRIEVLTTEAEAAAQARAPDLAARMRDAMRAILDAAELDEARVAQELAVLAVKQDVTEEIDRLRGHVAAARDLLGQGGAVGRKLDFLSQEFNREANTLCSKAQNGPLTALGLDLKAVIDQMREQIQNLE
ncbi:MAG: putative stress-induced protein [Rhodobacteraceae bacterium HLUCCA08]|nr:MAG: putative stress-induced protein [Rhodobacteraceae bacterium HLUCCA08]